MKRSAAVVLCLLAASAPGARAQSTERVSVGIVPVVAPGGTVELQVVQALGGDSTRPAISGNGQAVAFDSTATNLVDAMDEGGEDTNGVADVFVHVFDTRRLSLVAFNDIQANGASVRPSISDNGLEVAFESQATNLDVPDTNGQPDILLQTFDPGFPFRASVATGGVEATGGASLQAARAGQVQQVAFESFATDLVDGDTNQQGDIFVFDRPSETTTRVSVRSDGAQATGGRSAIPDISDDGGIVAFQSDATNLVPSDTNARSDIFVRDRTAGTTSRVSITGSGAQASGGGSFTPALSGSGRFVAFASAATNLVTGDTNGRTDIFVRDRSNGAMRRVSVATGGTQATGGNSANPTISDDGRFVAFQSAATNLVPGDTNGRVDVFVHDRSTGTTTRVSVQGDGTQATGGDSANPSISDDGRFVAFESDSPNLVANDTNGLVDVFVRDRGAGAGFSGSWRRVRLRCGLTPRPRGCTITGRLTISNPGLRRAARSRVHLYLSKDGRLDAGDRLLSRRFFAPLGPGRHRTIGFKRALPRFARKLSRRFLIAKLDATNRVREADEKNNAVVFALST